MKHTIAKLQRLIKKRGGKGKAAKLLSVDRRTVRRWCNDKLWPDRIKYPGGADAVWRILEEGGE